MEASGDEFWGAANEWECPDGKETWAFLLTKELRYLVALTPNEWQHLVAGDLFSDTGQQSSWSSQVSGG